METMTRFRPPPRAVVIGLWAGWLLIVVKCLTAPWVIAHWSVPIHPGWVIVPTLILAALITFLILTHNWKTDVD